MITHRDLHPLGKIVLFVCTLFVGTSSAFGMEEADKLQLTGTRTRFRSGIALEGGALMIPSARSLGTLGAQVQFGVQFSDHYALYLVPSVGAVIGDSNGLYVGGALLAEYTLFDTFAFGIGPDVGSFVAIGDHRSAGGSMYGARLHFGFYPLLGGGNGSIRTALALGLDFRFLGGGAAVQDRDSDSHSNFVFAPMLTLGYQSF